MRYHWMVSLAIASLAAALLMTGCGGGGSSDSGGIQLFLSDAPIDARAVDITISRVDVSKSGAGWTTLKTYDPELTLNLLDYRYDGDDTTPDRYLLADTPLEPGHYTQVRLILTKIELVDSEGVRHDVEMNSQDLTGLKIIGEFDVAPGTKAAVLIDFDASRSIVVQGNGIYRLMPTVRVVPLQITGSITGTIVFKDSEGADIEVPENVSIAASQNGAFVAASPVIDDGSFLISALFEGSYDLELEFPQGTDATHAIPNPTTAVVTINNITDMGTITASPVP